MASAGLRLNCHLALLERLKNRFMPLKKTIMTIDDDPVMLNLIVAIIRKDYLVRPFVSVKTAFNFLALPERPKIDLMLLDYLMPEMNGPEVLRRLRADPDFVDMPVIFLTGLDQKKTNESRELTALGAVDFVGKPPTAPILLEKIKRRLGN